ncbi:MAG: caspase family protein, partial [Spirochaetales bacterium]
MKTRKSALVQALVFFSLAFLIASCSLGSASITTTRKALLIGITDYPGTNNDLTYPAADAEAMQTLLYAQGWEKETLTNSQATKNGIQTAIHDFLGSVPADGTALIYYSGHGTVSNLAAASYQENYGTLSTYSGDIGDALLVPYDFDTSAWTGGISASDLSTWFDADLLTKNVIVIADSCFSGGFVPTSDSIDAIGQEYAADSSGSVYSSPLAALGSFGDLLA